MRLDFFGLCFETPGATFFLWSPWRASALEHRLFEAVRALPNTISEDHPDERRVHIQDAKTWKPALQALSRVLKGWQEEADLGDERRSWRWLIDADVDINGYDHNGDPASLWAIVRASIDRGGPGEEEKGEDIDFEGFGLRIWGEKQ